MDQETVEDAPGSGFGQMLIFEVLHALVQTSFSISVRDIYFPLLLSHSELWITQDSSLTQNPL